MTASIPSAQEEKTGAPWSPAVGEVVTNGHWHDRKTEMRLRVEALAGRDVWVQALTGPHKGHRLTFSADALRPAGAVS